MNILDLQAAGKTPAIPVPNNVLPFPKHRSRQDEVIMLDINEFVTGGKTGVEFYLVGNIFYIVDINRFDGSLHYKNGVPVGTILWVLIPVNT